MINSAANLSTYHRKVLRFAQDDKKRAATLYPIALPPPGEGKRITSGRNKP
jgi:hypothetical protein